MTDHDPGVAARFYPGLAAVTLALSFLSLFDPVERNGYRATFGSVFELAVEDDGGPALLGIVLLAGLIGMMVVASIRVRSRALPAGIAIAAGLLILMLLVKPGTGTPKPDLSDGGMAGIALAVAAIAVAVTQFAELSRRQKGPN